MVKLTVKTITAQLRINNLFADQQCVEGYDGTNNENYWPSKVNVYFAFNSDPQELLKNLAKFEAPSYLNQNVCVESTNATSIRNPPDFVRIATNRKRNVREAVTNCLEMPLCAFLVSLMPLLASSPMHSKQLEEATSLMKLLKRWDTISDKPFDKQHAVPQEVHDHLMKRHGVTAFGVWKNEKLKIFVEKEVNKEKLKAKLEDIDKSFFLSVKLQIRAENIQYQKHLKQGDKVFRNNDRSLMSEELGQNSSQATLGAFVKKQASFEDIYILTCGHVYPSTDMCAYGKLNELSVLSKIGTCIFTNLPGEDNFIDFSVVQVSKDVQKSCMLAFMRSENQKCNATVYKEEIHKRDYVHKNGATTGWADGRIQCSSFVVKQFGNRKDVFLVLGEGGKFCEPGDSGSIVFAPEDTPDQEKVNVLGMLMGSMQDTCSSSEESSDSETIENELTKTEGSLSEDKDKEGNMEDSRASSSRFDKKDDDLSRKTSCELAVCFRIDSALKLLQEETNLNVEFENLSLLSDESD